MTLYRLLERQPQRYLLAEAIILILLIGVLDFYTGYEVSLSILYGVPIYVVAWYCDKKAGILIALIAGLTWWWADIESGHPYPQSWQQGWETFVRLAFFVFVAIGAAALRAESDTAKARIALLEHTQRLEQEIIRISEHEQRRIGQDLHDGLCQYLAAVGCAAAALKTDLERQHLLKDAESADELAGLLQDAVVQTRDSARRLVPLQLAEAGLAPALEELAASVTRMQGINCTFESNSATPPYEDQAAMHFYRIAQEAINNAAKHGKARNIALSLEVENGTTTLRIVDDGIGISKTTSSKNGMGLSIMNYRARLSGGKLNIEEREEGGTIVQCTVCPEKALNHESAV